jgi:3',5'-cyclic AMP phosphodiesterase CpdA
MTVIAHISDLHFGAEDKQVVQALIRELNDDQPDLIAISGDLTQGGRRHEFANARAFINRLDAPVLAVPGNHDLTPYNLVERFVDPYARWRHAISPDTEPVWREGRVAVFGLNTAHRAALHWDWSRGRVTRVRLERLLARAASLPPDMLRVVVAHHPFVASEERPRAPLVGRARSTLARFAAAGIGLVLSGHVHRSYARFGASGKGPLIVQAATTTSVRLRGEPNAYNRIRIDEAGKITVDVRSWQRSAWLSATSSVLTEGS